MSRSVTMNYERYRAPSGSHLSTATGETTMPRYSEALNEILENVSAPPARDTLCPICGLRARSTKTRKDARGEHWCEQCLEEFDSTDWDEIAERRLGM